MAMQVPEGFSDLYSAIQEDKKLANVIGVVTDLLPPRQTKGMDFMLTFSIDDGTTFNSFNKGQKVRWFGKEKTLPPINGPGDAVLLRQVRCMEYYGQKFLVSTHDTQWILFTGPIPRKMPNFEAPLQQVRSKTAPKASKADMEYVIHIANNQNRSNFSKPLSQENKEKLKAPSNKFSLVKDVAIDTFYDFIGQVVKLYYSGGRLDLYITDYTEHQWLYKYGDQDQNSDEYGDSSNPAKKWEGPPGKYTLLVVLQDPHSYWTRENVNIGDFVHVQNVRIRKNYHDEKLIEGNLWRDNINPDRVKVKLVTPASNEQVKDLLTRKHELGLAHILESRPEDENVPVAEKRKAEDEQPQESKQSKNKKRRAKQKQAKAQGQKQPISERPTAASSANPEPPLTQRSAIREALTKPNKNIRCKRFDVPERTVSEILSTKPRHSTGPISETTFRAIVRIVDFKPRSLEQFTRSIPLSSSSHEADTDSNCNSDSDHSAHSLVSRRRPPEPPKPKQEWNFALLLEDAMPSSITTPTSSLGPPSSSPPNPSSSAGSSNNNTPPPKAEPKRMVTFVTGRNAEFLLNMTARDLRENPQTLAQLREKMFLLWGDLEERKSAEGRALKERSGNGLGAGGGAKAEGKEVEEPKEKEKAATRPFTCCIREYGVQNGSGVWERRFALRDTTIMQGEEVESGRGETRKEKKTSLRAPLAG